jgi:hypothetical protein
VTQSSQVLCRVNRPSPGKAHTLVVDFVNGPEAVRAAFAAYFDVRSCAAAGAADAEAGAVAALHDAAARLEAAGLAPAAAAALTPEEAAAAMTGGAAAAEDLATYVGLCRRLGREKFQLPVAYAAAVLAHRSAGPSAGSGRLGRLGRLRVDCGGVEATHVGEIYLPGRSRCGASAADLVPIGPGPAGGDSGAAAGHGGYFVGTLGEAARRSLARDPAARARAVAAAAADLSDVVAGRIGGGSGAAAWAAGEALLRLDLCGPPGDDSPPPLADAVAAALAALRSHPAAGVSQLAAALADRWAPDRRAAAPLPLPARVLAGRGAAHVADSEARARVVAKLRDALAAADATDAAVLGRPDAGGDEAAVAAAQQLAREIERHMALNSVAAAQAASPAAASARGRDAYAAAARRLLFNLRGAGAGDLRRRILAGELPPAVAAAADPDALAPASVAAARQQAFAAELAAACAGAANSRPEPNTAEYVCGGCGGRRCHVQHGLVGGQISSEPTARRAVLCCDCGTVLDLP